MKVPSPVNRSTQEAWCIPSLIKHETQFLILDRCGLFVSAPLSDCLEGVTQICSLEVLDHFEGLSEAQRSFERLFEYAPQLEIARTKPLSYVNARTVELRDWCEGGV